MERHSIEFIDENGGGPGGERYPATELLETGPLGLARLIFSTFFKQNPPVWQNHHT
jgi:hypothetical protein